MAIGRVYRAVKYDLMTRLGRSIPPADRERLYARAAEAVRTARPGTRIEVRLDGLHCLRKAPVASGS